METVNAYRKAIAGLVVPALLVIIAALLDGSDGGRDITTSEWLTALVAALGTSGTVAAVRNVTPSALRARTESVAYDGPGADAETVLRKRTDRGESYVGLAVLVLIVLVILIILLPRL